MYSFFKFKFLNILDELNVEVVTKICFISFIFQILVSRNNTKNSPTLEQWNQTNLPFLLSFLFKETSLKTFGIFFFFIIL